LGEKAESRKPKSEGSPRSEIRSGQSHVSEQGLSNVSAWLAEAVRLNRAPWRPCVVSGFGFRISFGFRVSGFGFDDLL
jgi:hypothetical protein